MPARPCRFIAVKLTEDQLTAFEAEVQRVVARDAADWDVSFRRSNDHSHVLVWVDLRHPLSPGFGWGASRADVEALDMTKLEEIIAREPDFEHIAQAPVCEHVDVVRGIRDMAELFYWRETEVSTLAGTLANAGCLTDEESEWLSRYAGREQRRDSFNVFGRVDAKPDAPTLGSSDRR